MFDLDTISSTITIAAACGAALVMLGLAKLMIRPKRRRSKRKKIDPSLHCYMCQRPTPEQAIHQWSIRSVTQNVCERCHPFYKLRFESNRPNAALPEVAPEAAPSNSAPIAEHTRVHGDTEAICP